MPNPLGQNSRVNTLLTDYSVGSLQDTEGFAHAKFFPKLPSEERAGFIGRYDRGDWWRNQFAQRAAGDESAGSGWKQDNTLAFIAKVWALHKDVTRQDEKMAQSPYEAMRDATTWLTEQAKLSREIEWAAAFFITGIWKGVDGTATDITGVAGAPGANEIRQWDVATSTPFEDLRALMDKIHLRIGRRPNKLAMGREVWTILADHADTLERVVGAGSSDSPARVMQQKFADVLELDELVVMDGIQVTSPENPTFETSLTTARIAGKHCLLSFVQAAPTLYSPSAGLTIPWTGYEDGAANDEGAVISDFWIQEKKVTRVEGEMAYTYVVPQPDGGIFINGAIG